MRIALVLLAALIGIAAIACDDDGGSSGGATSTVMPGSTGGAGDGGPTANPSVIRSFTGGSATASVTVAGQTYEYEGGICTRGAGDEYLAVNIGDVGGDDYFAVIAGRSPAADADTRSTQGGGAFSGDDVLITFVAQGNSFLLRSADTTLTLDAGLTSGDFTSIEATNNADVTGEFTC